MTTPARRAKLTEQMPNSVLEMYLYRCNLFFFVRAQSSTRHREGPFVTPRLRSNRGGPWRSAVLDCHGGSAASQ